MANEKLNSNSINNVELVCGDKDCKYAIKAGDLGAC